MPTTPVRLAAFVVIAMLASACAAPPSRPPSTPTVADIESVIDDWHAAAARADEDAYFGRMSEDAVFLGTDATERWNKQAFRRYAHPHFAKGKAWSFRAVRRAVILGHDGDTAWFDEDLATPNLGPARGSGVVVRRDGRWLIAHYNLAVTVPNERFDDFKKAMGIAPAEPEPTPSSAPPSAPEPAPDPAPEPAPEETP